MEKKKMINEENKRIYILGAVVVGLIIAVVISMIYGKTKSSKIIENIENLMKSNEPKAIYIMRDGCSYCTLNKSNMESIVSEYGLDYYNVNADDLTSSDFDKMLSILGIPSDDYGTPYMLVVQNGEVKDRLKGIRSYNMLFDFAKKNNLISNDSKLYLNYPTLEEYYNLIKSNTNEVIVLATSTCQYCLKEHPVLVKIAKETDAKINYVYLDYIFESQEEYNEFLKSLDWFETNTKWGTPTTLVVNNKKVKTYLDGYRDYEDIMAFYKDNGIVK